MGCISVIDPQTPHYFRTWENVDADYPIGSIHGFDFVWEKPHRFQARIIAVDKDDDGTYIYYYEPLGNVPKVSVSEWEQILG